MTTYEEVADTLTRKVTALKELAEKAQDPKEQERLTYKAEGVEAGLRFAEQQFKDFPDHIPAAFNNTVFLLIAALNKGHDPEAFRDGLTLAKETIMLEWKVFEGAQNA